MISLFAGCGGSTLGYRMAGYRELLAVDFDGNACETFQLNFPDVPVWRRDIREIAGAEILSFCGIARGELDVLDGSPPCQGFSTSGKRRVSDPRNDLVMEYVRLVSELGPKAFVMENVSGMVKGSMKGLFKEYLLRMKALDYGVKVKLLNAKYYGVPQSRQRLIFIGVRKDLNRAPVFPTPSKRLITVREALEGCPPGLGLAISGRQKQIAKLLKPGESGSSIMGNGKWFTHRKLDPSRPSCTIQKEAWQFYH